MAKGIKKEKSIYLPKFAGESTASYGAPATSQRRNRASTIERSDKYKNINDYLIPFEETNGFISISSVVRLCRKAYYNFSLLRNTIDVMTELSNSSIYLKGGNKASRDFVKAWLDKINIWGMKEKFFREFFRSGNVFFYRFDGEFTPEDKAKVGQVFAATPSLIPIRYLLLNPEDICVQGSTTLTTLTYFKTLNGFELEKIRNPKTPEDQAVLKQLGIESGTKLKAGIVPMLTLDRDRLYTIFYKKQDYESFAVPMAYPVLDDINWKLELKKMDQAIARTTDWAVLLITMGAKPDEGGINVKAMQAMHGLFENESVKRVLVSDYTTKGEWLLPDIAKILGPEKYQIVNEDIKAGLNIMMVGDEKFANSMMKTQIFLERLKEARNAFLDFLQPEIKKICKDFGFKVYPKAMFEEIDLKDELQFAKLYTRLMEIGVLTAEEGLNALETGELPTAEDSLESQKEYKKNRDAGMYAPLIGGAKAAEASAGRPSGTKAPQTTKKISPIGASFSFPKIKDLCLKSDSVYKNIVKELQAKYKIKKLSNEQENVAFTLCKTIMVNEPEESWEKSVSEYIKLPKEMDVAKASEIDVLAAEYQVDEYSAILLNKAKINESSD